MGQPGKVQTTLLTPVDVVKAEWLSKSSNRNPDMLAAKPPKPKIIEIAKDLPEYIIDPGTKTTYLKGKFLGKRGALSSGVTSVLNEMRLNCLRRYKPCSSNQARVYAQNEGSRQCAVFRLHNEAIARVC
ncbi:uncharacterized protein TNCT_317891 [Trichonephila clavata]|uniref:Uncharacterized protein n=1 Tax=Trichonephila clavata TaxID=2740835 RepID=A0A8X6GST9_TRICU|nr:uncharacterized protein TNCT_317891 [Trichonephila clavata]